MIVSLLFLLVFREVTGKVGYWPKTLWPAGKFGLPKTRQATGCPEASDFKFEVGTRIWDCEDDNSSSDISSEAESKLDVILDKERDLHLGFCIKNVEIAEERTGGPWPAGKYCIFRVGGSCPDSFEEGWIEWKDESNNNRNKDVGVLPDGIYDRGITRIYFCCRTDGDPEKIVSLPRDRSFYLLQYGDACQNVEGTRHSSHYVLWDSENDGIGSTSNGTIPRHGVIDGDVKLIFCYYTAFRYCGNPGVPEFGSVMGQGYAAGNTLKFSCDEGYRVSGEEEITCLSDEHWTEAIPSCKEIENCKENDGGCDHFCRHIGPGKHECYCKPGYRLHQSTDCVDINECLDPSIETECQLCINTRGGYTCSCRDGYELQEDQVTCKDINECEFGLCEHECTNYDGGYTCSCREGFVTGKKMNECEDINECDLKTDGCDHYCINTPGSYECGCITDFELQSDNRSCVVKDPCANSQYSPCSQPHNCRLDPESELGYKCKCDKGYSIGADGVTCNDIDECALGTHKCTQECVNRQNGYDCNCWAGYHLGADGRTCVDIDECACESGENCGGCQHKCINTQGSYHCQCNAGYVALKPDFTLCVIPWSDEDPCRTSGCIEMQYAECIRISPNETQCICKAGYFMNVNNTDCMKGFCETNPCPKNHVCQEGEAGRTCYPDGNAMQEQVSDEKEGILGNMKLYIIIAACVVVAWIIVTIVVCLIIKRKRRQRAKRQGYNEFPPIRSLPPVLPIGANGINTLQDNPIYRSNSVYSTGEHEYEELDKFIQRKKKLTGNSYDQGMDLSEPYSYAVTPGPPPQHLAPNAPNGGPDFV